MTFFPDGFVPLASSVRRYGALSFATRQRPAVFWIVAAGFITPSMLREELHLVRPFGMDHPEGWSYVVDTTRVRLIHPLNPLLLRQVRELPNNSRYIIVAPPFVRFLGRAVSPILRPTHIVSSPSDALAIVHQQGRHD